MSATYCQMVQKKALTHTHTHKSHSSQEFFGIILTIENSGVFL